MPSSKQVFNDEYEILKNIPDCLGNHHNYDQHENVFKHVRQLDQYYIPDRTQPDERITEDYYINEDIFNRNPKDLIYPKKFDENPYDIFDENLHGIYKEITSKAGDVSKYFFYLRFQLYLGFYLPV